MTTVLLGIWLIAAAPGPETAADVVTLRDGKVLLGQMREPDRRGGLIYVVARRAWVESNLPDRYAAWRKVEEPINRRAEAQRRARLTAWRRDRPQAADPTDRITAWLDASLARPVDAADAPTRLMLVRLNRGDIKTSVRRPARTGRLLRLGWTIDLADVETMPVEDLRQAVEARGFAPDLDTPALVDDLLPAPMEPDDRWMLRRAATEVSNDTGNRFLRYQGMLLPEPAAGEALPASAGIGSATEMVKNLLGEAPATDPLADKLRALGAKGQTGALVTTLELGADLSAAAVTVTLWVRVGGPDRWLAGASRSGLVRVDEMPANAGAGLAEDPQVKAVFGVVESLGLGNASELKARSLAMGAATRAALGRARAAIDDDLQGLAIPLEAGPKS